MKNTARILIVDEDAKLRQILKTAMEASGYETIESSNGRSAVRLVSTESLDLIILDLNLPDIDGVNLIGQIREWSKIPIIVLSNSQFSEENSNAIEKLANDLLSKPFTIDNLMNKISACLENDNISSNFIEAANFKIDTVSHAVMYFNKHLPLDSKEYKILKILFENRNLIVTYKQISLEIGEDYSSDGIFRLGDYISSINQKLSQLNDESGSKILPEPKLGYRLITNL